MTTSIKFRGWPFKQVLTGDFKTVETKTEIKAQKEGLTKLFGEFVGLVQERKKKGSKEVLSQDDFNAFSEDCKVPKCEDDAFKSLRPDKTMCIKPENWVNALVKPYKKKGLPAGTYDDVTTKLAALLADWKTMLVKAEEARIAEKKRLTIVATFFKAVKAGDTKTQASMLDAEETSYLLNYRNENKGFSTPIMVATREKNIESINFLLGRKCDLKIMDSFEWTALNWARSEELAEIEKILVDAGCEVGTGSQDSDDESDEEDEDFNANAHLGAM